MRILITNDDGINAPGLAVLEELAREFTDDVWIVAPEQDNSAAGHSLTVHLPLRIRKIEEKRYAVSGTPTDSALLGLKVILKDMPAPDLVLSGVNIGANIGEDITYSGTVAAAMEATLCGIPAIALSQAYNESTGSSWQNPNWSAVKHYGKKTISKLIDTGWESNRLMNVNFPACQAKEVKGIRAVHHGLREVGDRLVQNIDPKGRAYYWIGPDRGPHKEQPGSDLDLLPSGYITITPISLDLTDYKGLETLHAAVDEKA